MTSSNSTTRRLAAAAGLVVALAALADPLPKAASDVRLVVSQASRDEARVRIDRFACLEAQLALLPDRLTYVEPSEELPDVEWYQRTLELGFGHLPFVERRSDAEQVVALEVVSLGSAPCGDVAVVVSEP